MSRHPDLFTDIDSMDPDAFARHLTEAVRFTFGNSDTVVGRDNVRDVWAGFCDGIAGVRLDRALYPSQLGELIARDRGLSQARVA